MAEKLPEDVKQLIDAPKFATVATVNPDGSPQASVMWITRDGDDVLLSITHDRQKYRNLNRDPRISVVVHRDNPQTGYVEVRGSAELSDNGGRELINRLFNKYIGEGEYPWDPPGATRTVIRVAPEKVVWVQQG